MTSTSPYLTRSYAEVLSDGTTATTINKRQPLNKKAKSSSLSDDRTVPAEVHTLKEHLFKVFYYPRCIVFAV